MVLNSKWRMPVATRETKRLLNFVCSDQELSSPEQFASVLAKLGLAFEPGVFDVDVLVVTDRRSGKQAVGK